MIVARRAIEPAERSHAFRARHAAYCVPAGARPPLMCCGAEAAGMPHDELDRSRQTLLYYVRDGSAVVGSSRLIACRPGPGLPLSPFLAGRAGGPGLNGIMEAQRLSLVPGYRGPAARRQALLALFSAMYADSVSRRCTRWAAAVRGQVFMLLSAMNVAIRLVGGEPAGPGAGGTPDGPLSGEPLFLAEIDLPGSAAWLFAENAAGYRIICGTDRAPAGYAGAQVRELRSRARRDAAVVARHLREWRTEGQGLRATAQ